MPALVILGHFEGRDLRNVQGAATELSLECSQLPLTDGVLDWLRTLQPQAVIVQADDERALGWSAKIRLEERGADMPILGLHPEPDSLDFARALGLGLDDLVGTDDSHAIVSRLRATLEPATQGPITDRGASLVLEGDEFRRAALGRALRAAGYSVSVRRDLADIRVGLTESSIRLVALNGLGPLEIQELLQHPAAERVAFVVAAEPRKERSLRTDLASHAGVRVVDAAAPPENIIFVANELENPQLADKRMSPRDLYGASVHFRVAGQRQDDVGYTYNVSAEGLFVRTLAPPIRDDVWLELAPPHSARRVRLEGRVVWRRPFRVTHRVTVPPGFGVQLTDASRQDMSLWRESCARSATTSKPPLRA